MKISYPTHAYYNILPNATLSKLYEMNGKALGIQFPEKPANFSGRYFMKQAFPSCYFPVLCRRCVWNIKTITAELWCRFCYWSNTESSQWISNYLAGSTDFGNLSFIVPGIHPFFYICTSALNHTEEYTEAAGTAARVCSEQLPHFFLCNKI